MVFLGGGGYNKKGGKIKRKEEANEEGKKQTKERGGDGKGQALATIIGSSSFLPNIQGSSMSRGSHA